MKKIFANKHKGLLFLACLLATLCLHSQSVTQNYIQTTSPQVPVTTDAAVQALSPALRLDDINYMDGMGRSVQDVVPAASPTGRDIVTITDYDNTGRAPKQYLTYTNVNPTNIYSPAPYGYFRPNALSQQTNFYVTPLAKMKANNTAFGEVKFDNSPLNMVKEVASAAGSWNMASGRTSKQNYAFNAANTILLFVPASYGAGSGNGSTPAYYPAQTLTEVSAITEDNVTAKSYYDNTGKLIATISQISSSPVKNAYTYYVYDELDQLTCVIPPAAYDKMMANAQYQTSNVQVFLLQYEYDARGRVTKAKSPNQGYTYYVYNALDQLVYTQNDKMASNSQWLYSKYDQRGRLIMTGMLNSSATPAALQSQVNGSSTLFEQRSNTSYANVAGYTNNAPPTNGDIYTVNYYDDYDFDDDGTADVSPNTLLPVDLLDMPCTSGCQNQQQVTVSVTDKTDGLMTGSLVKVLDGQQQPFLRSVTYYDERGRVVHTTEENYAGGSDINTIYYDFVGKVLASQTRHTAYSDPELVVTTRAIYDKVGRVQNLLQRNNNDPVVVVNSNSYNEIEQLVEKNIHSTDCNNYLQSVDYTYNELGWLTHLNNADLNNGGTANNNDDANDLFGYELKYNTPATGNAAITGRYDGVVTEVHWKSYSDAAKKAYACNYDLMDRMNNAFYNESPSPGSWVQNDKYSEYGINYDANGNITTLKRNGFRSNNTFGIMDDLTYNYITGNRLENVSEASPLQGYNDMPLTVGTYGYDVNGNLINDPVKGLNITYNFMDMPVTFTKNGLSVQQTYDATGQLLVKRVVTGTPPYNLAYDDYTYVNGFNYMDGNLQQFGQPEGRCVPNYGANGWDFMYEYALQDHLGNNRINFSDVNANGVLDMNGTEVLQENHYYPFGLDMMGLNKNQVGPENEFKFNGKEHYEEMNMNLYNFGPRMYDPVLGRWNSVDPMADGAPNWTPYRYGYNSPMNFNDPTGMDEESEMQQNSASICDVVVAGGGSGNGNGSGRGWYKNDKGAYAFSKDGSGTKGWTRVGRTADFAINGINYHGDARGNRYKVDSGSSGASSSSSGSASSGGGIPNIPNIPSIDYSDNDYADYNVASDASARDWKVAVNAGINILNGGINLVNSLTHPINTYNGIKNSIGSAYTYLTSTSAKQVAKDTWNGVERNMGNPKAADQVLSIGLMMPISEMRMTDAEGFLFRGVTVKAPFNISVQRFGNMSLGRGDFWGLRIGSSKFANRTFAAIKPSWNPLTQYTKGVIPKGTPIKMGIIGPQGWRYPGGSFQFIVDSKSVIKQTSKYLAQ